ncbi:MAG: hypothetical protein B6I36_01190 [Desulfobacteraceae bacterium 4572_35.1]|nr:MAG: hypothetical protein B6I36_01190 [Desulfobacteraceae bacterium 4572_35.1]
MKTNFLFLLALVACLLFAGSPVVAMETDDCLACHTCADDVGEDNVVDAGVFSKTQHAEEGCAGCHEVSDEHPDSDQSPTMAATCADCHDELASTYTASVHGDNATCTECHNPHAAFPPVSLSGVQMNKPCQQCHESAEIEATHARWLPEAEVHISSVACVTCHSSSDKFVITLYPTHRKDNRAYAPYELMTFTEMQQTAGTENGASLIDTDSNGEISLDELSAFYANSAKSGLRLWAMMTPENVDHDFRTMDDRWDCTYCHAAGPEAMDSSYVAFPQADGTYKRLPMEKGATLNALFGTPDFYMVGATRSKTLNIIGLLILLGGLAMPIGHGSIRFLTRKNRRKEH